MSYTSSLCATNSSSEPRMDARDLNIAASQMGEFDSCSWLISLDAVSLLVLAYLYCCQFAVLASAKLY